MFGNRPERESRQERHGADAERDRDEPKDEERSMGVKRAFADMHGLFSGERPGGRQGRYRESEPPDQHGERAGQIVIVKDRILDEGRDPAVETSLLQGVQGKVQRQHVHPLLSENAKLASFGVLSDKLLHDGFIYSAGARHSLHLIFRRG